MKKTFPVEQIVSVLKQAEVGVPIAELIRKVGITEQTYYRWKAKYAGLEVDHVRQAACMLLAGAIVGLTLAWFSGRFVSSYLYGVRANDAVTLVAVALLLAIGGFTAAFLPATRAASINPVEALRTE